MKKLTAGIFTIMLGLVAVDANAAITSKAYVDDKFATKETVESLETNKADKATTYTKTEVDTKLGDKQNNLTQAANGSEHISIDGNGKISATGLTTSTEFSALSGRVTTAEGKIDTLEGTVDGLTSGSGSVANQIADALKPYTNTEGMNQAIATATNNMETQTHAAATYATKGELTDEESARTQADSDINLKIGSLPEGMTNVVAGIAEAKQAGTAAQSSVDSLAGVVNHATTGLVATKKIADDAAAAVAKETTDRTAADTAINEKIGAVAEGTTVVKMIEDVQTKAGSDLTELTTKVTKNTNDITAMDAAYKAADATLTTAVGNAQADATQALNESIKKVTATGEDGTYVLTIKTVGDIATLKWEDITREGE